MPVGGASVGGAIVGSIEGLGFGIVGSIGALVGSKGLEVGNVSGVGSTVGKGAGVG